MIADILGLQPETQPLLELIMGTALVIYMGLTLYLGSHHCQERRALRRCKKAGFLTTDEEKQQFYNARVNGILDGIRDDVKRGGDDATVPTEAALAKIFADRFESTFMLEQCCDETEATHRVAAPQWIYCFLPRVYGTSPADVQVRHACMRMISILTTGSAATEGGKLRLESAQTVDHVLEIASWDPRLNFRLAFVSDDRESPVGTLKGAPA